MTVRPTRDAVAGIAYGFLRGLLFNALAASLPLLVFKSVANVKDESGGLFMLFLLVGLPVTAFLFLVALIATFVTRSYLRALGGLLFYVAVVVAWTAHQHDARKETYRASQADYSSRVIVNKTGKLDEILIETVDFPDTLRILESGIADRVTWVTKRSFDGAYQRHSSYAIKEPASCQGNVFDFINPQQNGLFAQCVKSASMGFSVVKRGELVVAFSKRPYASDKIGLAAFYVDGEGKPQKEIARWEEPAGIASSGTRIAAVDMASALTGVPLVPPDSVRSLDQRLGALRLAMKFGSGVFVDLAASHVYRLRDYSFPPLPRYGDAELAKVRSFWPAFCHDGVRWRSDATRASRRMVPVSEAECIDLTTQAEAMHLQKFPSAGSGAQNSGTSPVTSSP